MKILYVVLFVILYSCSSTKSSQTFVVVGHEYTFDNDTINIVRRTEQRCKKSPVYPIGTVICSGKLKLVP